jgi:hypothetical protein
MLQQSFLRRRVLVEECGTTFVRYRINDRWNATVSWDFVIVRDLTVQGSERSWVRNLTTQAVFQNGGNASVLGCKIEKAREDLGS